MEIFMDDFLVYGSSFEKCLEKFENSTSEVPRQEISFELEKMSFHGNRGYCLGEQDFCSWVRSRPSKGFCHKNSLATYNS